MSVAGHHLPIWFDEATGPADGDVSVWNSATGRFESAPVVGGAIPDGTYVPYVTTLTGVAIQAALDAKEDDGGDVELLPNATYTTLLPVFVNGSNITLKMNGATIQAAPGAVLTVGNGSSAVVVLRGTDDVTLDGGTIDVNGATNSLGVVHACDNTATLVATRHTVRGCRVINATNSALRTYSPYVDLTWDGNVIEDCTKGINALAAPVLSTGLRIIGNRIRRTAGVGIQVYSATASKHADVLVEGNDLRDFTTPASAIPIEVTGSDKATIRGNNIATVATRGVSTGNCTDLAITGNTIVDQTMYAVEIGGTDIVKVTGNLARGCASLVQETLDPCTDVLIADNIYVGSGLSAAPTLSAPAAVIIPNASKRVRVTGNIFTDWQHLTQGCVRIGSTGTVEDAVVEGNTFVATDADTPLMTVSLRKAVRSSVLRNTIRIERDLVAGDDYVPVISQTIDAASADHLIEGNQIIFTGTVAAAPNASGVGNGNVGAGALPGVTIRSNTVTRGPRGLRLVVNSTDMLIATNVTSTCSNADVIPATAAVPQTADIQSFSAGGTWTKPIGSYSTVTVKCVAGGGGGGAGRRGAAGTVRCGGGGAGAGGTTTVSFPYSTVPSTQAVVIGASGAGGIAQTVDDTNGADGTSGGLTSWGAVGTAAPSVYAQGGQSGFGGRNNSGPAGTGGLGDIIGGAGGAASGTGLVGAAGASASIAGGGAGGGITTADVAAAGGAGGTNRQTLRAAGAAGAADASGSAPALGSVSPDPTGGSGGGGGGAQSAGSAGAGGAGATWGAGGGGGGASLNGSPSGAGGAGGGGFCQVITA